MKKLILLPNDSFDWHRWRAFSLFDQLGIRARYNDIHRFRAILRNRAIGYSKADGLRCRPKPNHYAVMFDDWTWCHLTSREFQEVFGE